MKALEAWLAMGGYAAFVWPAYGVAGLGLGALALASWRRHRDSLRELARLQRRQGPGA